MYLKKTVLLTMNENNVKFACKRLMNLNNYVAYPLPSYTPPPPLPNTLTYHPKM